MASSRALAAACVLGALVAGGIVFAVQESRLSDERAAVTQAQRRAEGLARATQRRPLIIEQMPDGFPSAGWRRYMRELRAAFPEAPEFREADLSLVGMQSEAVERRLGRPAVRVLVGDYARPLRETWIYRIERQGLTHLFVCFERGRMRAVKLDDYNGLGNSPRLPPCA